MNELKMSELDYELFLLVHGAFKKADLLLTQFLIDRANRAGVSLDTHRFNIETRAFEPKPQPLLRDGQTLE